MDAANIPSTRWLFDIPKHVTRIKSKRFFGCDVFGGGVVRVGPRYYALAVYLISLQFN